MLPTDDLLQNANNIMTFTLYSQFLPHIRTVNSENQIKHKNTVCGCKKKVTLKSR
jgi:hypothetical protein